MIDSVTALDQPDTDTSVKKGNDYLYRLATFARPDMDTSVKQENTLPVSSSYPWQT